MFSAWGLYIPLRGTIVICPDSVSYTLHDYLNIPQIQAKGRSRIPRGPKARFVCSSIIDGLEIAGVNLFWDGTEYHCLVGDGSANPVATL